MYSASLRAGRIVIPVALVLLVGCPTPEFVRDRGPPEILRFSAFPWRVRATETTTIEWHVIGADFVELVDPSQKASAVEATGSRLYRMDAPRDGADAVVGFTLVARNNSGESRAHVSLEVAKEEEALVAIAHFEAHPNPVHPGETVEISWSVLNATSLRLRIDGGDVLKTVDADDSLDPHPNPNPNRTFVNPAQNFAGTHFLRPEEDVILLLRVEGRGGPLERRLHVGFGLGPPLILDFRADPPIVVAGEPSQLLIEVARSESIAVARRSSSGASIEVLKMNTREPRWSLPLRHEEAGMFEYTLTAQNEAGVTSEALPLHVLARPELSIEHLEADPPITGLGGQSRLRWRTRHADGVRLSRDSEEPNPAPSAENPDRVGLNASTWIEPQSETTTWRLEARALDGQAQVRSVTVAVDPELPVIDTFSFLPDRGPAGERRVEWATINADVVEIMGSTGALILTSTRSSGSATIDLTFDSEWLLEATNTRGRTIRQRHVSVIHPPRILEFRAESAVRVGRPIRVAWQTRDALSGELILPLGVRERLESVPSDSFVWFPTIPGRFDLHLQVSNESFTATSTIEMDVLPAASSLREVEPNDRLELAHGPMTFPPQRISGRLDLDDRDVYTFRLPVERRLKGEIRGDCRGAIAIQITADIPRVTTEPLIIHAEDACPSFSSARYPALAQMGDRLVLQVQDSFSQSSPRTEPIPYELWLELENRICGDGVLDLMESCDAGAASMPTCDGECRLLGLVEREDNDRFWGQPIQLDATVSGHLEPFGADFFWFDLSETLPVHVTWSTPGFEGCSLRARVSLLDASGRLLAYDRSGDGHCADLREVALWPLPAATYIVQVLSDQEDSLNNHGPYVLTVSTSH